MIDAPRASHAPLCAVAIGASAGGVHALRTVVAALPADLAAAVFVVLHLHPQRHSLLPKLLATTTSLRVQDVRDEGLIEASTLYVAVPDRHLLVADGRVRIASSAPVHYVRPSVDRLFESIARTWRTGAVGVLLTGNGCDGASGIAAIKLAGGCTIVQDPGDAEYASMPKAAIATGLVDAVLPVLEIGPAIASAVAAATAGRAA